MSRGWGYAVLTALADVMIGGGSASHFTGLALLTILGADAVLLLLFGLPHIREARQKLLAAHRETAADLARYPADVRGGAR